MLADDGFEGFGDLGRPDCDGHQCPHMLAYYTATFVLCKGASG